MCCTCCYTSLASHTLLRSHAHGAARVVRTCPANLAAAHAQVVYQHALVSVRPQLMTNLCHQLWLIRQLDREEGEGQVHDVTACSAMQPHRIGLA